MAFETELLIQAMLYKRPERIPVCVSVLPAAWLRMEGEMRRLAKEYPDLLDPPGEGGVHIPDSYRAGSFLDEWGCRWTNVDEGMEAIVTDHPVPRREDIAGLSIPPNRDGRLPHGFMYLRLLDLRGFEEAMYDFADECDELDILIGKVLKYNCRQIEAILPTAGPLVSFGDDLGMQNGLAIGPEKWRRYMKPCYQKMYRMVRDTGRLVYMHTDGMIYEIMPDLMECGVNMLNPQFSANGLDNLERVCRGKIPINLDLDRQMFPFATPSELHDHVRECVERLYLPEGGLGLNVEFNYETPIENMAAVLEALRKYREYKG